MPLTNRFAEYVAELQQLNEVHRLAYGKPGDLLRFLEAAEKSQSFSEEFGCAMRSIAIRENFKLSDRDYLTLIGVACTGIEPDKLAPELSCVSHELSAILHKALAQRVLFRKSDETEDVASELPKGNGRPELEADVQGHPQLGGGYRLHPRPKDESSDADLRLRKLATPNEVRSESVEGVGRTRSARGLRLDPPSATELSERQASNVSLDGSAAGEEGVASRGGWFHLPEILTAGLVGLVVALLINVNSLPIYRAHVSVYLQSANANPEAPSAHGSSPQSQPTGSLSKALLDGELTGKVAEGLLDRPQSKPILREDVLSRGMRDLHLGGTEPILYADLVAETAHQVSIAQLQPQNLYVITCDSWSSTFAAMFCNELAASLNDQPAGATSRTIDAALQPGVEIYPHWYRQGSIGLAIGCLASLLAGLLTRPRSKLEPPPGDSGASLRLTPRTG